VTVYVSGFPTNIEMDYRIGKQGEDPSAVVDGKMNASGSTMVTIYTTWMIRVSYNRYRLIVTAQPVVESTRNLGV
jgi:hypothetical protein